MDEEMGLPLLLRTVLPVGMMGVMMAAYFSAIMSTADSCLMAASGNVTQDLIGRFVHFSEESSTELRVSQLTTLILGSLALALASVMQNVLEMMLYSYAFMVSGLFIPVIAAIFFKRKNSWAALISMLGGGTTTLVLIILNTTLPLGLDPILFGLLVSLLAYLSLVYILPRPKNQLIAEDSNER